MTPKEKAKDLVDEYLDQIQMLDKYGLNLYSENLYFSIQCAIIAVDELLNDCDASSPFEEKRINYWQEVKEELIKLKQ